MKHIWNVKNLVKRTKSTCLQNWWTKIESTFRKKKKTNSNFHL